MIHIVTSDNLYLFKDEMEQAYRLRHRIFVEEMKWSDLAKPDGREIDQFDDEHAVHMLYVENGKVLGYQRMLPTTRPHLLSELSLRGREAGRKPHLGMDPVLRRAGAPGARADLEPCRQCSSLRYRGMGA